MGLSLPSGRRRGSCLLMVHTHLLCACRDSRNMQSVLVCLDVVCKGRIQLISLVYPATWHLTCSSSHADDTLAGNKRDEVLHNRKSRYFLLLNPRLVFPFAPSNLDFLLFSLFDIISPCFTARRPFLSLGVCRAYSRSLAL